MAEMDISRNRNLLSSRSALLKASLENSRAIASALHQTGEKLDRISQSLPSLEAAARPFPAQKCTFAAITDHVDRAVGPAAAVLNVHSTIQELQKSVSADPGLDLYAYLSSLKRLEEALKFLANNCGLAIQWLQDILQFLQDNSVSNEPYICNVRKSLRILLELEGTEKRARIDGGVLFCAFRKLETVYKQLLVANSVPVPLTICSITASRAVPVNVVERLQAITERLRANNRLSWCTSAYVEVRVANAKRSLEGIDLNYLDKPIIGSDDVEEVEGWIDQWSKHLELIVKNIFEVEFNLSKDVFCSTPDVSINCFTEIATRSGILSFLQFGRKVTECKKDAITLIKLLDIFTVLDNLRGNFNRLFGGTSCIGIRSQTRSLIKSVVDGACEIFFGLTDEVSCQREVFPASNGCVPRLVSFVTEYCNELLGDKYRPLLEKVLMIHQSWKQEKYQDELLTSQIRNVLKEIGLNLDSWSKAHVDAPLSYLFMMNNHCHFSNLRGTKLGHLMGDSWLKAHEQYKDHFMALYLRESWGKVIGHLRPEGQAYSSPAKVSTKGLKTFNQALDNMYQKQSSWVVPDENLRLRICKLLVQSLVPVYRSYLQSYKLLIEQDPSAEKHVKYTPQGLETMLSSLFQQKMTKYRLNSHAYWISKIKGVMSDHFQPTLMAA
ncbi:Exocyst complex component EXO70A1 [Linum grandiflorum]